MLKPVYAALLLAGTGLGLAACSDSAETPSEIAPEGIAGLEITNARMMLPPVAGNPAAVYFDIAYDGERNLALRSADVAGAERAVMHDMMEYDFEMTMGEMPPLMLQPGDRVSFEPGGKHVMAFDLLPELAAGGTTEVTLIAAGGDKHSFAVPIQAAGEER
ncbi:copper chaperone PCu(A)C [Qipengyuania sp. DY56-A-20]|jgi:periplasmic copper chaperone A|uniref:Copper chaperone PCu(A)C n=1 Tax=Qipengyuania benthica TaxID=3067651 RepID=A0ABT9H7E6_9SPHN|nr:copper chaperone PCu(A)C [Qipengyuania sp. DY56-A-20]MDP4539239.1 copper chaperone PCu(A)C [Qipengyuania sp. DY56-A-20]